MKDLKVGIVTCASMHEQIKNCLASLEGAFRIYPIIPSCTFSVKIDLIRYYLDRSTAMDDITILAYGICHPQILPLLAEYDDRVVRMGGSNCFEMFLGSEKYTEYHEKCYWMLNKPFFTKWKNEVLTGFGAGTSNGRALISNAYKKLVYVRFEKDELDVDLVEDFARTVSLKYEIYPAEMANFKRLLEEALASTHAPGRTKAARPYVSYPRESGMRTIIQNIGEVIYKVDVNTKQFTFVSPQVKRILGYTPDEFLDAMNDYLRAPFYNEDDRQRVATGRYEFLAKCLNEGMQEPYEAEYRAKRKNGDELWLRETIYPSYISDGIIESFIGKIADITERKQMEEDELRKFKSISDGAVYGAAISKLNGTVVYVNEVFARMHGYTVEELIGKHLSIFHTEEQTELVERLANQLRQKRRYMDEEVWHKKKDGTVFPTTMTGTAIMDDKGKPLYLCATAIDITDRKQAEEELRIAEQNFRNSLDNSPLGVRIVTMGGELLYANQAILDIYGYSSIEELKAIPVKQRYTPESYAEHQQRKEKRKLGKPVPSNYEISIVRKDGEIRYLAVFRKEVIWNGQTQFQALYQDITERKRAEEALREYQRAVEGSEDLIAMVDKQYVYRMVNETFLKYNRLSRDKVIGHTVAEVLGEDVFITTIKANVDRCLLGESVNYEMCYNYPEIGERYLHVSYYPFKSSDKKVTAVIAIINDITERRQAELALRQSEEFSSGLLSNSPNPIIVLNIDASIKYVNLALEKLTGFSSAELVGRKPPYPWYIEETREESSRELAKAMRRGARKCEQLFRKRNGELFWVESNFKTVKTKGEFQYHLINWVDMTEQKRLRENMKFYISEVTRAQEEERKRIAREIHDDSIQALASLALDIDAIAGGKADLPKDVIQSLERIRLQTNGILDGLRRFSHRLRPGVIDQVGLVPALEILTYELDREGTDTSLEITGSERRLKTETELVIFRIAQEALHNIRRHAEATRVKIRIRFAPRKVRLTVADNGKGFEAPRTLSDFAAEGKLGLVGMQERTHLLNGIFSVKSKSGSGTTISVEVENVD